MCQFALGSIADECLIQWRVNGSNETAGELTLSRTASPDNITVTEIVPNVFSAAVVYIAEAVGVNNGQPTDMLRVSTLLSVTEEAGEECLPQMSKLL